MVKIEPKHPVLLTTSNDKGIRLDWMAPDMDGEELEELLCRLRRYGTARAVQYRHSNVNGAIGVDLETGCHVVMPMRPRRGAIR